MPRGRDVAWSKARTAMPKTEATTSHQGEEWGRESEAPWTYTSSPYQRSLTSGRAASKPSCVEDQHMKTPRRKESPWGRRSRPNPRGGWEATGPRPTPSLARGTHTESSPEAKTTKCGTHSSSEQTGRPKDDTKTPRGQAGKKRSQEPICSNSFIRDQIVRSRPDRGDPILKEYRPDIESRLRYDWVGENHLDPQGDRIAKQLRIDERKKFVPIECAGMCNTTRYGWPHREGSAPTTRESGRRVFAPIEI